MDAIVTGVYNAMRADKEIGKVFARFRLERLKDRTVDYLRGEWGGEQYKGPDLWISHSHLGVNNHWYDIMMKYWNQICKKLRIPKTETEEIIESIERMRRPIVDPNLKFKNMYLAWEAREAAKNGGDGWGMVAGNWKDREKKEKETLEKLAKMQQEEALRAAKAAATAAEPVISPDAKAEPKPAAAEKPKPKRKPKPAPVEAKADAAPPEEPKPAVPDWQQFVFKPEEDAPPETLPSSMQSGAEILYRLSCPPKGIRCGPTRCRR